jgi:membrane fusion protein (multidrug efflux system)
MKRYVTYAVVVTGLAGLGGWAYYTQHAPARLALEISATSSTAAKSPVASVGSASAPAGGGTAPAAGVAGGPRPAGGTAGGGRGPVGVEAARAQSMAITEEVFAVGNLRANESVTIRPEIAGRVVRIGFTEGGLVRKGDLLVELDRSVLLAQVEQARAELDLSKANYDRTADLAERKFVSASAKDQAAANLSVQQAKLRLAEAQLAKTQIFAPFNGVVGLRNFSVGDYVREAADLVVLEDVSQMKVDLRLPERFLGELKPGLSVEMRVDAYPQRVFRAAISALDVQVSADGRALIARGMLANQEFLLRSGMFARARIVLKERGSAVMVPEEAVYPMGADVFVYKIIDGKAMRARVATGVRRDGKVEITEGVVVGDLVVTAGQIKLARDGTEVRVQSAGGGPRGGGASDSGAASGGGAASDGGGQGGAPKGPATRPAG